MHGDFYYCEVVVLVKATVVFVPSGAKGDVSFSATGTLTSSKQTKLRCVEKKGEQIGKKLFIKLFNDTFINNNYVIVSFNGEIILKIYTPNDRIVKITKSVKIDKNNFPIKIKRIIAKDLASSIINNQSSIIDILKNVGTSMGIPSININNILNPLTTGITSLKDLTELFLTNIVNPNYIKMTNKYILNSGGIYKTLYNYNDILNLESKEKNTTTNYIIIFMKLFSYSNMCSSTPPPLIYGILGTSQNGLLYTTDGTSWIGSSPTYAQSGYYALCGQYGIANALNKDYDLYPLLYTLNGGQTWIENTTGFTIYAAGMVLVKDIKGNLCGIAGDNNGGYYTIDGGQTWHTSNLVGARFISPSTIALSLDTTTGILYGSALVTINTGTTTYYALYYTTDGGQNWYPSTLDSGVVAENVACIALYGSSGTIGTTTTANAGLYYTRDGGQSWARTGITVGGFGDVYSPACVVLSGAYGIAGSNSNYGIYYSTDGGLVWTPCSTPNFLKGNYYTVLLSGQNGLAQTSDGSGTIYYTSNGGYSWLESSTSNLLLEYLSISGTICCGYNDKDFYMYYSTDGGKTWTKTITSFKYPNYPGQISQP